VSLPTIGLVQASTQAMADRFAYLPLIGVFMVMVWVADDYFMKFQRRRTLSIVAATGVLIAFSAVTWGQLGYWHDSISLFTHALAVTKENPVAENNLGTALDTAGQHEEALKHFVEAIRIKPRNPQAYNNLGNVLDDLGRSDEALAAYEQALKLRPNTVLVHNNLGVVLAKLGRYDEARTNFLCAMNLKPRDAQAYYLMGTLYLRMGDARAAVNAFETALQTNPEHLKALAYLARLFAASDDPSIRNAPQAVAFSEKAVALTARAQPALLDTAAMAYAEAGRFDDALKTEQAAVDLLKNANETNAVNEILPRVALFQARQPYRENCTNLIAATTRHESR
jgi:tetratricopeptide (TPR) repeat protein